MLRALKWKGKLIMRDTLKFFLAIFVALVLAGPVACSGGDDDDDDNTTVDANNNTPDAASSNIDASGGTPDAAAAGVLGLGQVCYGGDCTTGAATTCSALAQGADHGFCTLTCGTTDTTDAPPADGNATCTSAYQGTTPTDGTPACALYSSEGPPYTWSCAVLCGTSGTTDLGGCPAGLTCGVDLANFCS